MEGDEFATPRVTVSNNSFLCSPCLFELGFVLKFYLSPWMEGAHLYREFLGKKVLVKSANGSICSGICRSVDGYLNIVLEDVSYSGNEDSLALKTCFIKGSGILHLELIE